MFAQIVLGWPAIITSLALCVAGLLAKRAWLVALGAAFFVGPGWYLSGYPAVRWFGYLLPACLFAAALALWKKRPAIAWMLTLPALATSAWLGFLVLAQ
jgi:hypothetical protein